MKLTLTIESGHSAAIEDPFGSTAWILDRAAKAVADGRTSGLLHDVNGNRVGAWTMEAVPAVPEGQYRGVQYRGGHRYDVLGAVRKGDVFVFADPEEQPAVSVYTDGPFTATEDATGRRNHSEHVIVPITTADGNHAVYDLPATQPVLIRIRQEDRT